MKIKSFDYYEFAGVIVPGAVTLGAIILLRVAYLPEMKDAIDNWLLLLVFSYAVGQLQQEIASQLYKRDTFSIYDNENSAAFLQCLLDIQLITNKQFDCFKDCKSSLPADLFRNLITWVKIKNGDNSRFEIFNAIEGTSRGLAVSCIIARNNVLF